MERHHSWLTAVLITVPLMAGGCGREAPPQPPVIRVAERTQDVAVHQEGTQAVLSWTYPSATTAGGPLPDLESIEIWRLGIEPAKEPRGNGLRQRQLAVQLLEKQGERIARLRRDQLESYTRGSQLVYRNDLLPWYKANVDRMPLVLWFAVRSRCCGGRNSEFSNIARLVPAEPPKAPAWKEAETGPDGVTLHWGSETAVLVERQDPEGAWRRLTPEPVRGGTWLDGSAIQGQTWSYRLRAVTGTPPTVVVGEPGEPQTVEYLDVYPPDPPSTFVCLPEPGRVRLRWEPSPAASSYRIFRQQGGSGDWLRLAWHFKSGAAFVDEDPPTGELTYAIKAVDAAGNESEAATCTTTVTDR